MTAPLFALDPQLDADCLILGRLALCRVLLMDDARFPWLILVPERTDAVEIIDLTGGDRVLLIEEIAKASHTLRRAFAPDKINVAALGNRVRQLHVHVIARFTSDVAWPNPVWGRGERQAYPAHAFAALGDMLAERMQLARIE
jgi:diadenosine tetraphosphate (Ap4A) HIT family hydrolase